MSRAIVFAALLSGTVLAAGGVQAQPAGYAPPSAEPGRSDRYGAGPAAGPLAQPSPRVAVRGRMLAWPGKTEVAQAYAPVAAPQPNPGQPILRQPLPTRAYAPPPSWRRDAAAPPPQPVAQRAPDSRPLAPPSQDRYAAANSPAPAAGPVPARARSYPGVRPEAPVEGAPPQPRYAMAPRQTPAPVDPGGWRPVYAPPSAGRPPALAGTPATLPTSIYTPTGARAAAAPAPLRTASADRRYGYDPTQDHSVRFYSVHRAFGLQPDPAPIPPQFFTATADLAEPPAPLTSERTISTGGSGTTHTVRAAPDTSTQ